MPPGPRLQKINAALHTEPLASIAYCTFWLLFLCAIVPVAASLVLPALCAYRILSWRFDWRGADEFDPSKHTDAELAVVVTGCDTGIGKELALWAAEAGYVVFAGCLNVESFAQFDIKEGTRIMPIVLDVTSDQDVEQAAKEVSEWIAEPSAASGDGKRRVLHGIVNNAGIERSGFFDWLNVSDYQRVTDVNYFGALRCCKAFLPILKKQVTCGIHGGSRIINVSSVAGLITGSPVGSPYIASKHAVQVLTEALRQELEVFGIQVTSINPSMIDTNMRKDAQSGSSLQHTWDSMTPELQEEYGTDVLQAVADIGKSFSSTYWKVEDVVDQIVQNLKARETPGQVLVGMDARYLIPILCMLPSWIRLSPGGGDKLIPAAMRKDTAK